MGQIDLDTFTPAYTFDVFEAGQPGTTFAMGDLDGDGIDEVIVGDAGDFYGQYYKGGEPAAVFVLRPIDSTAGNVTYPSARLGRIASDQAWFDADPVHWGPSLLVHDLDGDGVEDLGVGFPGHDGNAGVFAWFTDGAAVDAADRTVDDAALRIDGEWGLGIDVALIGDVDGDGVDEYAVSELGPGGVYSPLGRVHVFSDDLPHGVVTAHDAARRRLVPPLGIYELLYLTGPGDVTDDGVPDLLVSGALDHPRDNVTYIVRGGW